MFEFFLLVEGYCFLEFIMVKIFVGVHVVETGIFVDLDSVDEPGVDLGSEDLFMVFGGLENNSVSLPFIVHEISSNFYKTRSQ